MEFYEQLLSASFDYFEHTGACSALFKKWKCSLNGSQPGITVFALFQKAMGHQGSAGVSLSGRFGMDQDDHAPGHATAGDWTALVAHGVYSWGSRPLLVLRCFCFEAASVELIGAAAGEISPI